MKRIFSLSQWLIMLLLCPFLIMPTVLSMAVGLTRDYIRGFRSGWTLDWTTQVQEMYHASIWMSLLVVPCMLVIVLVADIPTGYVLVRRQSRASRLAEEFLTLSVALLGLATALGLIVIYGGFGGLREDLWFIIVGYVVSILPLVVCSVAIAATGQNLKALEEGVTNLGASFWQRFRTIVLPSVQPGTLANVLTVATFSMGGFNLTWVLHTLETKTLPVGLADTHASMCLGIVSAYTLIFSIMIMPLLVLMQRFDGLWVDNGKAFR